MARRQIVEGPPPPLVLDLRRLLVFREVARLASFSAAADVLHYSQSAVSHHIARLEVETGAKLFERRPGGRALLTAAGKALLAHADRLLRDAAEAEAEIAEIAEGRSRRIRVGAFAMASATYLPHAIAHLRRTHPEATVMVRESESTKLLQDLEEGDLDLAIVFDDRHFPLPLPYSVTYRYLFDEHLLLGMPKGHRLATYDVVPIALLVDEPWIGGAARTTTHPQILKNTCRSAGFEPQIVVHSNSYILSQRLVTAGVGLAFIPEMSVPVMEPNVVVRRLDVAPTRRVGIASRNVAGEPEPFREMIEILIQACTRGLTAQREGIAGATFAAPEAGAST
jgi:DNA-binding transcriptional LysR family regulator